MSEYNNSLNSNENLNNNIANLVHQINILTESDIQFTSTMSPIIRYLVNKLLIWECGEFRIEESSFEDLQEIDFYGEHLIPIFNLMSRCNTWDSGKIFVTRIGVFQDAGDLQNLQGFTVPINRTLFDTTNCKVTVEIELSGSWASDQFIVSLDLFTDPEYLAKYRIYLQNYEEAEIQRKELEANKKAINDRQQKMELFNKLKQELFPNG